MFMDNVILGVLNTVSAALYAYTASCNISKGKKAHAVTDLLFAVSLLLCALWQFVRGNKTTKSKDGV